MDGVLGKMTGLSREAMKQIVEISLAVAVAVFTDVFNRINDTASWFQGGPEWGCGLLILAGFWNRKPAASAGGFPAMVGNLPFLMQK